MPQESFSVRCCTDRGAFHPTTTLTVRRRNRRRLPRKVRDLCVLGTFVLVGLVSLLIWIQVEQFKFELQSSTDFLKQLKKSKQTKVDAPREGKDGSERFDDVALPNHMDKAFELPEWLGEEWKDKECVPFAKWQLKKNGPSTGNIMHEMDISEPGALHFINCGGSRCAFSFTNERGETVILKWVKMAGYEKPGRYEAAWKDVIAMERLQGSEYILNIFGNCGSSQLIEVAAGGALYDQMVLAKNTENAADGLLNNPETNLRASYHVARAVADLHSIDGIDGASFVHRDICCDQYLFVDGVFKLNDFNYATTQMKNRTSGLGCKETMWSTRKAYTKLRAPEEVVLHMKGEKVCSDKVDVWLAGNVLYYVLTKKWVMEGLTNREAVKLLAEGKRSPIPSFIKESKNRAHQAMICALDMAWTQDPDERPPAREIAAFLEHELIAINGGKSDSPWPVSARPLPPKYDFGAEHPSNAIPGFVGWYDNYKAHFPD